jgi:hypothetical protein
MCLSPLEDFNLLWTSGVDQEWKNGLKFQFLHEKPVNNPEILYSSRPINKINLRDLMARKEIHNLILHTMICHLSNKELTKTIGSHTTIFPVATANTCLLGSFFYPLVQLMLAETSYFFPIILLGSTDKQGAIQCNIFTLHPPTL